MRYTVLFLVLFYSFSLVADDSIFNLYDASSDNNQNNKKAKLIIIDKIVSKTYEIETPINENHIHNDIRINVEQCEAYEGTDIKNFQAFLTIYQNDNSIFQGWIFSDSISLNTLENPVYEIFLSSCLYDPITN